MKTPADFGAVPGQDSTAAIKAWLECPDPDLYCDDSYLIAAAGPDAGGVVAYIPCSKRIEHGARSMFAAGAGLDNTLITIRTTVPGLSVEWIGGRIDVARQKNSTVVPYSKDFPPKDVGASATCDGLAIDGGSARGTQCFEQVTVRGLTVYAGEHWQTAGGDSGVGIRAARTILFRDNTLIGCRDCGFYPTGLADKLLDRMTMLVTYNTFIGCMVGVAAKRAMQNVIFVENDFIKCAFPMGINHHSGHRIQTAAIYHNRATGGHFMVANDAGVDCYVFENRLTRAGALDAQGKQIAGGIFSQSPAMINFEGAYRSWAIRNQMEKGNVATDLIRFDDHKGLFGTDLCVAYDNTADVARFAVNETQTGSGRNRLARNRAKQVARLHERRSSQTSKIE